MGGTKIKAGLVVGEQVETQYYCKVNRNAPEMEIVQTLSDAIAEVYDDDVDAIGIGVPTLVNVKEGIVYDVQNIPAWREVALRDLLSERFPVRIEINNDANCFAMGEKIFGGGKNYSNLVGMTLGTGLGSGLILNDRLVSGENCGAGEFGSIPYRDDIIETYASGKFFRLRSKEDGETIKQRAIDGDGEALSWFREYGDHLGHAIITVLFAVDPAAIILGGSISRDFDLFQESMWKRIRTFTYQRSISKLKVFPSTLENSPVLGAAALCLEQ